MKASVTEDEQYEQKNQFSLIFLAQHPNYNCLDVVVSDFTLHTTVQPLSSQAVLMLPQKNPWNTGKRAQTSGTTTERGIHLPGMDRPPICVTFTDNGDKN